LNYFKDDSPRELQNTLVHDALTHGDSSWSNTIVMEKDFLDDEQIKRVYYPEMEELLKRM